MGAKLLRISPYYAEPNLHHKATVGNMYGLTLNKNKLLHLVARMSEIVIVIQVGLGSVKMTDQ